MAHDKKMSKGTDDIVRRDYKHGKVAYGFQWNKSNHLRLGNSEGDLASLWAHLTTIQRGNVPDAQFTDPFYSRASKLKLKKMSNSALVGFRKMFERSGKITKSVDDPLVGMIREYHRNRNDISYSSGHEILIEFIHNDPNTIALEVPVWSERYKITGHIDLVRWNDGILQISDYKPGSLDTTNKRFMNSVPQVAAYGEMITHHLASTLREALGAQLLPSIQCCIFDTHSCWTFGAEMFVTLYATGKLREF
ncbi:MAG: PD-(D/E)XK nuclease family protein [Candidatus Thorarchaeota archaeon]